VVAAALAPDGATVAAGHADGSIVLRDVETEREIGEPLVGHDNSVTALAFSRKGTTLASADSDGTILLWPVDLEAWKRRACRMAGRSLTDSERNRFLGDAAYEPACRSPRNTPETPATIASDTDTIPTVPKDMVLVPAGWFSMGCNADIDKECYSDEAWHRVYVETFAIDRTEVRVADYRQCVEDSAACDKPNTGKFCNWGEEKRDEHPVNCVDWFQAKKYCEWKGRRLPREAEWEKAARGPKGNKYPWGNDDFGADSKLWANIADETAKRELGSRIQSDDKGYDDKFPTTAPVGSFLEGASPYGALNMSGNVWEWVWDKIPGGRGLRGGSWDINARDARASYRLSYAPDARSSSVGFRCAQ
jgi:formylglycine-generating enzyme required for sulfatase activity